MKPSSFRAIDTVSANASHCAWNAAGVEASSVSESKHLTHAWSAISGWAWRKASALGSGSDGGDGGGGA